MRTENWKWIKLSTHLTMGVFFGAQLVEAPADLRWKDTWGTAGCSAIIKVKYGSVYQLYRDGKALGSQLVTWPLWRPPSPSILGHRGLFKWNHCSLTYELLDNVLLTCYNFCDHNVEGTTVSSYCSIYIASLLYSHVLAK